MQIKDLRQTNLIPILPIHLSREKRNGFKTTDNRASISTERRVEYI